MKRNGVKLTGRTILITGGSSGIGLALATQLARRGNTLILTGRDGAKLDAARRALPSVHTMVSDVSDPAAIADLHGRAIAAFPALDTLVNNAGIMRSLALDAPRDLLDLTREIDCNLSGPLRMVQQFLPQLASRPEALIVNVSSGLAFVPLPSTPIYCATKAALHAYTLSLRAQLAGSRVRVVELAPPAVDTPLLQGAFASGAMDATVLATRAIAAIEAGSLEIAPGAARLLRIMGRAAPDFMLAQLVRMTKAQT
ncbi:SDR family oxidoreductase [Lichenicoccus sp.]|uniref:SDR family oxidoreductase n=1 Tax=Lichenicoccus sp. TaxID=2781899 RepID=UPI003D10964F